MERTISPDSAQLGRGGGPLLAQPDYQKYRARTCGGPLSPDMTLVERTICIFFRRQSGGAPRRASAKYVSSVTISTAARVPKRLIPATITTVCSTVGLVTRVMIA